MTHKCIRLVSVLLLINLRIEKVFINNKVINQTENRLTLQMQVFVTKKRVARKCVLVFKKKNTVFWCSCYEQVYLIDPFKLNWR